MVRKSHKEILVSSHPPKYEQKYLLRISALRGRPQRTSAIFRGGGGTQLQTFADMRGGGVSGMQTSAFLEKVLEGLRSQKNFSKCKNESVDHRFKSFAIN